MTWSVVRGIYKEGIIEPVMPTPYREGIEVLVLFPEQATSEKTSRVWQKIKQGIVDKVPELKNMTDAEKRADFDRLSTEIATNLPYNSVEEFERAMWGDDYGLVGY